MWAVGLIIGALVAGAYSGWLAPLGAILGVVAGIIVGSRTQLAKRRIDALETRLVAMERAGAPPALTSAPAPAASAPFARERIEIAPAPPIPAVVASAEDARVFRPVRKGGVGMIEPAITTPSMATECAHPEEDSGGDRVLASAASRAAPAWIAWITGGNALARVGVLLLFIGVGFLVKYASAYVRVPIEMRLAAVALGATALLVLGWRLRLKRPGYAMILQGGGVGVLYLTVFGALRLYALLSPGASFALLVAIAGLSAWLAIRQDAIAMAAVGIVGGFLAPILASSNSGSHVILFAYYTLLNAGILAIACFKAWRSLNVLGFLFTFVIATMWGVTRYRPENFATTEPFLVLFFVFYVAIAVLYALRESLQVRNYVDSTLVFGTPLFVAGLQAGMVRNMPYAMALSALAMSAVYLLLARGLYNRRSESLRLLVEAFLALGTIFATLAIPLAVDSRLTSATWALEGAAMLWVGIRQRRLAVRAFGLLLQLGAGIAFASGTTLWQVAPPATPWPVLNSEYIGAVIVGLAGLFSARLVERRASELNPGARLVGMLLLAWGTLWWVAGGLHEIERWVPAVTCVPAAVVFLSFTAVAFELEHRREAWPGGRIPPMLLIPALLLIAIAAIGGVARRGWGWPLGAQLFADGGIIAWPLGLLVSVWLLRQADHESESDDAPLRTANNFLHAGLLWLGTLIGAHELAWVGMHIGSGTGMWTMAPWGLVPALALAMLSVLAGRPGWPFGAHRHAHLVLGAVPIVLVLALWSLGADLAEDVDPMPLPYLPLFNPLDIVQALLLCALALWWLRARAEWKTGSQQADHAALAVFLGLAFFWINAIALRAVHFWFDVAYTPHDLWHSRLVQAVLALLWSSTALGTMLLANRRRWRAAWIAGALLLAAVVAKLFLVDLSQVGGLERIVSFIGVGLLLLLIGYLAPVPPRRAENAS